MALCRAVSATQTVSALLALLDAAAVPLDGQSCSHAAYWLGRLLQQEPARAPQGPATAAVAKLFRQLAASAGTLWRSGAVTTGTPQPSASSAVTPPPNGKLSRTTSLPCCVGIHKRRSLHL